MTKIYKKTKKNRSRVGGFKYGYSPSPSIKSIKPHHRHAITTGNSSKLQRGTQSIALNQSMLNTRMMIHGDEHHKINYSEFKLNPDGKNYTPETLQMIKKASYGINLPATNMSKSQQKQYRINLIQNILGKGDTIDIETLSHKINQYRPT